MSRLAARSRVLLFALIAFLIGAFLLTPLSGLETRPTSRLMTLGAVTLAVFFVGVVLAALAVVFLFLRRGSAPLLAMVGAALFLPGVVADQTENLSHVQAPTAIFWIEKAEALIAAAVILLAFWAWGTVRRGAPPT